MGRLNRLSLSLEERAELSSKVDAAASAAKLRSLLVVGSANIAYLTGGVVFPYLDQRMTHPVALHINFASGRRTILCTADLVDIPGDCGWDGEVLLYELVEPTPEQALAHAIQSVISRDGNSGASIGFDAIHMSGGLHRALTDCMPDRRFHAIDGFMRDLRITKTSAEIRMLEIAARIGDRGYISALNHAEGAALDRLSFPLWEYAERFRVHVGEFEGSGVGNLAVMQGQRAQDLQHRIGTREVFEDQSYLRLEYSMSNRGYWNAGSRTAYVGKPGANARQCYADNLTLRTSAVDALTAGARACDVFHAVKAASVRLSIPFWEEAELGHGVGTSEREAPYLAPHDMTILRADMVVTLGVYTFGENRELICNRDLYRVRDGRAELLSWYKDWNYLYPIHGTSARHG